MTDLPAAAREGLAALLPPLVTPVTEQTCDSGTTRKTLWRGHDGTLAESVLMGYPDRATVVHLQPGGLRDGVPVLRDRSGRAGAQPVHRRDRGPGAPGRRRGPRRRAGGADPAVERRVHGHGRAPGQLQARGRGAARITDPAPDGLGISARGVTVSTVGLVPAIDKLAAEGIPVTLAVSLHAPDDELRDTLVPVNNRWKVGEVLDAARRYATTTGRRVSIEYALIRDVNDQPWRADLLGTLLRQRIGTKRVHVNLIPLNPTPGSEWDASPRPVQDEFVRRVQAAGVACTVRDTRGREIAAACGQLAADRAARHGDPWSAPDRAARLRAARARGRLCGVQLPVMPPVKPMLAKPVADDPAGPALRAQVGRLPVDHLPRRRRGRDRQPQRAADDPLLPRGRRGRPGELPGALGDRRRDRRRRHRPQHPRLRGAPAAHPPRREPGEPAGRADPRELHRLRPARPRRRRPHRGAPGTPPRAAGGVPGRREAAGARHAR